MSHSMLMPHCSWFKRYISNSSNVHFRWSNRNRPLQLLRYDL